MSEDCHMAKIGASAICRTALESASTSDSICLMANSSIQHTRKAPGLIQRARKKAGLTQEQLAETIGISVSQISRFESGKRRPRVDELEKIAQCLDIPIGTLVPSTSAGTSVGDISQGLTRPVFQLLREGFVGATRAAVGLRTAEEFGSLLDEGFRKIESSQRPPDRSELPTGDGSVLAPAKSSRRRRKS